MQIELSLEEQITIERLVQCGRFESIDDAVHAAVEKLAEEHDDWVRYVRESVHKGEEDVAAGRVTDGHEVIQRLRTRMQRAA